MRSIRFSDDRACSFDEMIRATQKGIQVAKQVLPIWRQMIEHPEIVQVIRNRMSCYPAIKNFYRRLGLIVRTAPYVIEVYKTAKKTGNLPKDQRTVRLLKLMSNLYILEQLETVLRLLFKTDNMELKALVDKFRKGIEPFSKGVYRKCAWQFRKDAGDQWL